MITLHHSKNLLKTAIFCLLAVVALFQLGSWRGLFADGSFQLLNLLVVENAKVLGQATPDLFHELVTSNNEASRFFVYIFTELPTIIALRLGATNLPCLISLFSSSLLLAPLLFWVLTLWKVKDQFLFWPFLLIFTVIYYGSNFFIVGEYNMAYALSACCLAFMLRTAPNKKSDHLLLLGAAILSVFSYASTIFMGILLAVVALKKYSGEKSEKMKLYWLFLGFLFVLSAGAGLWGALAPAHPQNMKQSHDFGLLAVNTPFWATLLYVFLLTFQGFLVTRVSRDILTLLLVGFAFLYLLIPISTTPFISYSARAFNGLMLFTLTGLVTQVWFMGLGPALHKKLKNFDPNLHVALPITALFCVLSLQDIGSSIGFRHYLKDYADTLNSKSGLVRFEDTIALLPDSPVYGWNWTYPTLGLLLRDDATKAVVTDPAFQEGRWRPFDPSHSVPDLGRYYAHN